MSIVTYHLWHGPALVPCQHPRHLFLLKLFDHVLTLHHRLELLTKHTAGLGYVWFHLGKTSKEMCRLKATLNKWLTLSNVEFDEM